MKISMFLCILFLAPMLMAGEAEVREYEAKLKAVEVAAQETANMVEAEQNKISQNEGASCPFPRDLYAVKGKEARLDVELNDQLDQLLGLKNRLTDQELAQFQATNDKITTHFMRIRLAQNTLQSKCDQKQDMKSAETLGGRSNPKTRVLSRDPVEAGN